MTVLLPETLADLKLAVNKGLIKDYTINLTVSITKDDKYGLVLNAEQLRWYLQGLLDAERKVNRMQVIEQNYSKDLPDDF